MKITVIKPHIQLITPINWIAEFPKLIEVCGRTCYKSEDKITKNSASKFIRMITKSGHHSVIEHMSISLKFIGDRSMSHQLVRHRIAAYSQESQRYCNYGKKGFQVICPPSVTEKGCENPWMNVIEKACFEYENLLSLGVKPEDARSVLPNAMKTEVVATYNLRQWRHMFTERALNPHAQWQIRGLMLDCLTLFSDLLPDIFGDLQLQATSK